MVRREKIEIIMELLEESKEPKKITYLMHKTNTNQINCKRYIDALAKAGFMEIIGDPPRVKYKATIKGIGWLKHLRESSKGLEEFNEYW